MLILILFLFCPLSGYAQSGTIPKQAKKNQIAAIGSGLDLPVRPPVFGGFQDPGAEDGEDDDDGDSPRDTPPPTFYGEEIDTETETIIYVIDISGSMGADPQPYTNLDGEIKTGSRLNRAKSEIMKSIAGLSPNFRFNIYAYSCSNRSFKPSLVEATDANKAEAISWTSGLSPTGGTGTGPAVALALKERENLKVVLLTDGSPNCGANNYHGHRMMIVQNNAQGATIDVFGISATGLLRAFCQGVASDNGGSYYDVP